jgi:poly-beta-1,6-N-acetyl-D-glucosamine biosynthesis protein PgaD
MKRRRLNFIINKSKDHSWLIELRDFILTALVWVLYFYFMRDFFYFVADVFSWAWNGFVDAQIYPSFRIVGTIATYIEALCVTTVIFIAWSFYNMARYGTKKRRRFGPAVDDEELAKGFHLTVDEVKAWHKARVMIVHHDDRGRITDMTVNR